MTYEEYKWRDIAQLSKCKLEKFEFVKDYIQPILMALDKDILTVSYKVAENYGDYEYVVIIYEDSFEPYGREPQLINVSLDSPYAILKDVARNFEV